MSGFTEPAGGTRADPSSTRFGSKPIRAAMLLLQGINLDTHPTYGATYIPNIDSPVQFRSQRLRFGNPAGTFYTSVEVAAIAQNQRIRIPTLTNIEGSTRIDDIMFLKQQQTMTKKTLRIDGVDPNIIQDASADASHMAVFNASGNLTKLLMASFVVPDHKNEHVFGGGDAFVKGDRLFAAAIYLEDRSDVASDFGRIWLEGNGDDIRYWSDDATPVLHSVATNLNILTLSSKTFTGCQISNYLDFTKLGTAPVDPAAEEGRLYLKTIDADNNGIFVKHKQGTVMLEEQITPRPLSPFSINDATDVTIATPLPLQRVIYNGSTADPQWINIAPPPNENPELKTGEWIPLTASTVKTGLFNEGLVELTDTVTPTPVTYGEDSKGRYAVFSTQPAVSSNAGLYYSIARFRREYHSKILSYWIGQSGSSNTLYYIGFTASATQPAGDAPLDSGVAGVLVALRVVDNGSPPSTLKILHNDAVGATVVTDTGVGYVGNTTHHKVEVHLSSTDVKVYVDDTLIVLTTEIPALTTPLYFYVLARRAGGGARLMTLHNCKVITK